ncbi:TIGR03620 family F420-dependent LLM class oxidoreductase [Streptosporangium sp. NPDC051022]|uniref:TIGR03620 family F420-dependent LLM class oxidoreductase n=1 Tax=Streptosporangium sp. NPDC051022 TaxID=3155752 RepID=UPI003430E20F
MTTDGTTWQAAARWGRVGAGIAAPATGAATWRRELARLERLPYGAAWVNEGIGGREAFSQLGVMLAATERLVVATGLANVWARQAPVMQAGAATLAEAHPGRVALGLGISIPSLVELWGQRSSKPLTEMRAYLDRMDASAEEAVRPSVPFPRLLGALGPRMLELARDRADGAYPHTMPVANTALARRVLGPGKLLVVGVGVILDDDLDRARTLARRSPLFRLPDSPYTANLRRLGYDEKDIAGEPSDRVVDEIFACGDGSAVAKRVHEHLDAGADHVVVQPLGPDVPAIVDQLERIAGHLQT